MIVCFAAGFWKVWVGTLASSGLTIRILWWGWRPEGKDTGQRLPYAGSCCQNFCKKSSSGFTREASTLNLSAGLGVQRSSRGRQPVVQTQIPVVQDLLCGKPKEKAPYYREKGLGVQGKKWPKYR